jgi:hypothetical protein
MNGPLRVGVISTLEVKSNVYTGLTDAIAGPAAGSKVDVKLITARDWSDFSKEMRPNRFQTMHVLVQTVLTPSGPQVLIGTKLVALERFVRKVSQPGTRLVVLQDVSEDPRAIAALRWGSQSLPSDCEASLLLCSAAPSAGFFDEMKGCYESLLCDKPIDQCITHLDRELEYGRVSLVTHTGTEHALGLREELDLRLGRQRQIHADFTRLGEPSKHMTSIKIREVEPVNSNWAN